MSPISTPERSSTHQEPTNTGRAARGGRQGKKRELGRAAWSRNPVDKRARNEQSQRTAKRRKTGDQNDVPIYATKYTAEEIAAEERQPKRKVAVLIGYSGSGYKGMQLNHQEKTIEGDLFRAFVAAGAISKANADDPKKSSLVRCARTDKGVHAAGNVISLKLVVEDEDIVSKINENLPPQIRVWGVERTNKSFSAYQVCDSRVYEYLIPTHCFLPPHPQSFLGQQITDMAEEENDLEGLRQRQAEVADFWEATRKEHLQPIIDKIPPSIRGDVLSQFHNLSYLNHTSPSAIQAKLTSTNDKEQRNSDDIGRSEGSPRQLEKPSNGMVAGTEDTNVAANTAPQHTSKNPAVEENVRALKSAQATAKRLWRIPPSRLQRVRSVLSRFVGSIRYHNYTVDKTWQDPSAMRVIKSFQVDDPIIIGGTEWLSLKVHGQSFMMHQIRKMVCGATMIVRCGCHEDRIRDTFLRDRISIPKAPSLGLLLEKPVFDKYNEKLVEFGRERVDFGKHEKKINEFKQKEIYDKIFQDEASQGIFLSFFAGLDGTRSASLLWLTSAGLKGTQREIDSANVGGQTEAPTHISDLEGEDEDVGQEEN